MSNEIEIWKDIPGFEIFYQASTFGRIRSYNRTRVDKNGVNKLYIGKILKPFIGTNGYMYISLVDECKKFRFSVHYLVAVTFCEGIAPGFEVNHKDLVRLNNFASNLEWTTHSNNIKHAIANGKYLHIGRKGKENHESRATINIETGEIFDTIRSAYNSTDKRVKISYFNKMLNGSKKNHSQFKIVA